MKRILFTTPNLAVLLLVIVLLAGLFYLATLSIRKAENPRPAKKAWTFFLSGFLVFVALNSLLALLGFFDSTAAPPRILAIVLPLLAFVYLLTRQRIATTVGFLRTLPPHLLVGIQAFRVLVELILVQLYSGGIIPVELTYYGQNGDLIIGLLALPVAWAVSRRTRTTLLAGIAFNILGLISLLNIFIIALRSVPGPFLQLQKNLLPTYFPGVLIPAVFVVCAVLFHVASLKQLMYLRKNLPTVALS